MGGSWCFGWKQLGSRLCSHSQLRRMLLVMAGVSGILVIILVLAVSPQSPLSVSKHSPLSLLKYARDNLNISSLLNNLGGHFSLSNLTAGRHLPTALSPRPKMLIYMCTPEYGCAGWSDRQRAFVAAFLLAQISGRRFGLMITTPCDVSKFYMPNKYDWRVRPEDLEGRSQRIINPFHNLSTIVDFNSVYPEEVLFCRLFRESFRPIYENPHLRARMPAWALKHYSVYFHNGWEQLMKPTPMIQARLDKVLASMGYNNRSKPQVGVHVRIGRNPSNPKDGRIFNNVSRLGQLWAKVGPYVKNGSQLFVASDSMEVRKIARRLFGKSYHDSGGIILHITKQKHDVAACQGFEDAIFDQLVLSYSDVLFRSRGGFSMRAGFMNRKGKKMHVLNEGKVTG